jgi:hypothetical protein
MEINLDIFPSIKVMITEWWWILSYDDDDKTYMSEVELMIILKDCKFNR